VVRFSCPSTKEAINITVINSALEEPDNTGSLSKFKIKIDLLDDKNIQNDYMVIKKN
jgi:hypothetical protein